MNHLRARRIYSDARVALVAAESIEIHHHRTQRSCQVIGKSAPVALIICAPDGQYAMDMGARPVNLDRLRQDVVGLDEILSSALHDK